MKEKRPILLADKDPWMLAEDIPDSDVFFFQVPMSCFASDTSYPFLKNYKKVLTHYKKFHMDFYFGQQDSFDVAESILQALLTRPNFGKDVNRNVVKWSNTLIKFARHTASLPLHKMSNQDLWELYKKQDDIHTKLYTYGWLPVAVDMFHNNFTKKLKSYLYGICSNKQEAETAFVVFTTPSKKSIVAKEREEFLGIYQKFKTVVLLSLRGARALSGDEAILSPEQRKRLLRSDALARNDKRLMEALTFHSKKWGHLGYIYAGNVKPFDAEYYLNEMKDLAETRITASDILKKEAQALRQAKIKQQALFRKLRVSSQYKKLFQTAADFALTKLIRRHAQLLALYLMHTSLLTEIAKRLKLTRYQVQFMLIDEVKDALRSGQTDRKILTARLKECVLYTEKDFEKIYIGKELKRITANLKNLVDTNITELQGQTAQPGFAKGKVKIIIRAKDMPKMNKGDILVSIATDPDIVPAMKKAAAIVTEQGGITSHAAIVSRELGIPCIIGTKIATKVLKDGDLVEVDANKGIVKKL